MSEPRVGDPDLAILRASLGWQVAATSLRRTARDVGMSPTALQSFLEGAAPYSETRHKLVSWYVRFQCDTDRGAVDRASAGAALALLTAHLPVEVARTVRGAVVEMVRCTTGRTGLPAPAWMNDLAQGEGSPSGVQRER